MTRFFSIIISIFLLIWVVWGILVIQQELLYQNTSLSPEGWSFIYGITLRRWLFVLGLAFMILGFVFRRVRALEWKRQHWISVAYYLVPYLLGSLALFLCFGVMESWHLDVKKEGISLNKHGQLRVFEWEDISQLKCQPEKHKKSWNFSFFHKKRRSWSFRLSFSSTQQGNKFRRWLIKNWQRSKDKARK